MRTSSSFSLRTLPYASTADQPRSLELTRTKRPQSKRVLRKSDLEDKLLITRTTGRQFGKVGEAWVEPRRLTVHSFDIFSRTQPLRTDIVGRIQLPVIKEVGDVVLIHSEEDYSSGVSAEGSMVTIPGLKLVKDSGEVIGRCVDFVFEPDSGRIIRLIFHRVNFPFANRKWFDQFAVPVQNISRIVLSERVIYLKDEAEWKKVGVGEYQFLANLLPSFDFFREDELDYQPEYPSNSSDLQNQYQELLEESRRQQKAYYAKYGRPQQSRPAQKRRGRAGGQSERGVRMRDWIVNEEAREELYMQE